MRPLPRVTYQISSTVRWATARDTAPGASVNRAMPPRRNPHSRRTSEPSGAIASGAAPALLVANAFNDISYPQHCCAGLAGRPRGGANAGGTIAALPMITAKLAYDPPGR